MNKLYKYAIYINGELIVILQRYEKYNVNDTFTFLDVSYKFEQFLEPIHIGHNQCLIPCFVTKLGKVKYEWVASCDDGAFQDYSRKTFNTKEECYNDMRNSALEKMKWNTEYLHDFDNEEDSIGYEVSFSQNEITHRSYSGLYVYKIVEVTHFDKNQNLKQ